MERAKLEAIKAKIPGEATFDQVKKLLTLEEMVGFIMEDDDIFFEPGIRDGDERLVASIIQTIGEGNPSTKRCTALLEATKDVLGYLQRLEL